MDDDDDGPPPPPPPEVSVPIFAQSINGDNLPTFYDEKTKCKFLSDAITKLFPSDIHGPLVHIFSFIPLTELLRVQIFVCRKFHRVITKIMAETTMFEFTPFDARYMLGKDCVVGEGLFLKIIPLTKPVEIAYGLKDFGVKKKLNLLQVAIFHGYERAMDLLIENGDFEVDETDIMVAMAMRRDEIVEKLLKEHKIKCSLIDTEMRVRFVFGSGKMNLLKLFKLRGCNVEWRKEHVYNYFFQDIWKKDSHVRTLERLEDIRVFNIEENWNDLEPALQFLSNEDIEFLTKKNENRKKVKKNSYKYLKMIMKKRKERDALATWMIENETIFDIRNSKVILLVITKYGMKEKVKEFLQRMEAPEIKINKTQPPYIKTTGFEGHTGVEPTEKKFQFEKLSDIPEGNEKECLLMIIESKKIRVDAANIQMALVKKKYHLSMYLYQHFDKKNDLLGLYRIFDFCVSFNGEKLMHEILKIENFQVLTASVLQAIYGGKKKMSRFLFDLVNYEKHNTDKIEFVYAQVASIRPDEILLRKVLARKDFKIHFRQISMLPFEKLEDETIFPLLDVCTKEKDWIISNIGDKMFGFSFAGVMGRLSFLGNEKLIERLMLRKTELYKFFIYWIKTIDIFDEKRLAERKVAYKYFKEEEFVCDICKKSLKVSIDDYFKCSYCSPRAFCKSCVREKNVRDVKFCCLECEKTRFYA